MTEAVLSALITGSLSLAGVVITCIVTSRKNENNLKISQAVTDTKLDNLTKEVQFHNNFARRMPVLEEKLEVLENRLTKLEGD